MLDPTKRQRLIDRLLRAAEDLESDVHNADSPGFEERTLRSSKAFVDECMAILNEGLTADEVAARQEQVRKFKRAVRDRATAKEVRARQEHYKKIMKSALSEEAYGMWLSLVGPKFAKELSALEEPPDTEAR